MSNIVRVSKKYGKVGMCIDDRENSKCTILPFIVIMGKFPECRSQGLQVNIGFNSSFN